MALRLYTTKIKVSKYDMTILIVHLIEHNAGRKYHSDSMNPEPD
jgi:hypothetical protein